MNRLNDDARWLVNELAKNEAKIKALGKPQLASSSIEGGKIEEYDRDGNLSQIIGEQHDGTHASATVGGPVPPEPVAPSVTVGFGSAEVRASGKFAGDALSPMDFSHFSVHASRVEVFSPDNESKRADIAGEAGDLAVILLDPGAWTFGLVAVSKAGKWSALSETVTVEVPDFPEVQDIQDALDDLDEKYDGVIAEAGTLGARLDQADVDLAASATRIESAESNLANLENVTLPGLRSDLAEAEAALGALPADIAAAQSTATGAAADAAAAQLAAQQAQSAALEAASRATSYLSNGGFELDLDSWAVDGAAPSITSDAQSGAKAARFTTTQAIVTESFPASAGQWWEVSGWYRSDAATGVLNTGFGFQFKRADNSIASVVVPEQAATGTAWAYVSFRVLVPAEAVSVRVRLARAGGTAFTVDSVVLRNVTEVVLLEQAASEAKAVAVAAKVVADAAAADVLAMASQVDGLQSDLAVNTVAIGQAESRLDELDSETLPALGVELGAAKDRITNAESELVSNTGAIAAAEADLALAFGQIADVTSAANRAVTYGASPPPGALPGKSLWVTPSGHTYISQEC